VRTIGQRELRNDTYGGASAPVALLADTCVLIGGMEQITEPAAISVIRMLELQSGLARRLILRCSKH